MAYIQRACWRTLSWAVTVALLAVVFSASSTTAAVGDTTRISVNSAGQQASGTYTYSGDAAVSADGRFVAFESNATDLDPNDTSNDTDIFVRDRLTSTTTLVSGATVEAPVYGSGFDPAISADGRFVAFASRSSYLIPDDTNSADDVFLHDRQTGITTLVSLDSAGQQRPYDCREVAISADGQVVAFVSETWNGLYHVFVKDLRNGQLRRASVNSAGEHANGSSEKLAISADGRFVAFTSYATNLVPGDTNGRWDAFVHDRLMRQTARVSISSDGQQQNYGGQSWAGISISADGRYVAFESEAGNLIPGLTRTITRVYVHDLQTGATSLVSVDSMGRSGIGEHPAISADGRYVAFVSGHDLAANDTNQTDDVFVHDRQTSTTRRVSNSSDGTVGDGWSRYPAINASGTLVVFESEATNLVAGDTNGRTDVFAHEVDHDPPATITCDGIVAATIIGTAGDDTLTGTEGPDVIVGLEGHDTIRGLGGDDLICGDGIANETRVIGGDDTLYGDAGNDQLIGSDGSDVLFGGVGGDLLRGNANDDQLMGEAGSDTLRGGGGLDHLDGGPDVDTLDGGWGEDTCINGESLQRCP